jgi:hypothetical protein
MCMSCLPLCYFPYHTETFVSAGDLTFVAKWDESENLGRIHLTQSEFKEALSGPEGHRCEYLRQYWRFLWFPF